MLGGRLALATLLAFEVAGRLVVAALPWFIWFLVFAPRDVPLRHMTAREAAQQSLLCAIALGMALRGGVGRCHGRRSRLLGRCRGCRSRQVGSRGSNAVPVPLHPRYHRIWKYACIPVAPPRNMPRFAAHISPSRQTASCVGRLAHCHFVGRPLRGRRRSSPSHLCPRAQQLARSCDVTHSRQRLRVARDPVGGSAH